MDKTGDHLSLLNIYDKFNDKDEKYKTKKRELDDWAYDNFLKLDRLIKAKSGFKLMKYRVNDVIKDKLDPNELGIKYFPEINELDIKDRVLTCFLMGYRLNTAARTQEGLYRTQYAKDIRIKISRTSFLDLNDKEPKNVFYNELFISMGKNELVTVSEIPKKIIKVLV